jgi:uncharacterized repeat protein (TIGR03837 family)
MTSSPQTPPAWDMFCKVVDNFGDLGVCWRMASQLADEHGVAVRLWVDDIALAEKFAREPHANIHLKHWSEQADFSVSASVVIETFSCGLPERYQQAMVQKAMVQQVMAQKSVTQKSIWINIDYLSAEAWVEGFHGKPSPQANGLTRYFFYPGFTAQSGGLLREGFLPALQLQAQASSDAVWRHLGLQPMPEAINISLFCYSHAPVKAVLASLAISAQPVRLIVPDSVAALVSQALECELLIAGQTIQHQQCVITVIPFLSQLDYDRLLSVCDLNFVRGEDSWIRAIWAAKPMIWLPYQQSENTHLEKLAAFLGHYLASAEDHVKEAMSTVMQAWAEGHWDTEHWQVLMSHRDSITKYAKTYAHQLSQQPDLATNLVIFIEKLRENRV